MCKSINSEDYNLNKRIVLKQIDKNTIGIVKKRKSRIIMKDGKQILIISEQIKKINPNLNIKLIISGPICSKTVEYLNNHKIEILQDNENNKES